MKRASGSVMIARILLPVDSSRDNKYLNRFSYFTLL